MGSSLAYDLVFRTTLCKFWLHFHEFSQLSHIGIMLNTISTINFYVFFCSGTWKSKADCRAKLYNGFFTFQFVFQFGLPIINCVLTLIFWRYICVPLRIKLLFCTYICYSSTICVPLTRCIASVCSGCIAPRWWDNMYVFVF